ncbi:C-GCAxxG-C-C family protein [Photobacterium sanguinicancri]|uniref:C-GCAxxG-C-C family protein n=1 Tax=Photobacterium sanguinicancri TaxID=875932 RepID=A0AAW7YFJ8_9GAMM|nr:C-GCAxxG-C-C family protein [Photobacterium sanguinicancri]MDO6545410.1 C-GCAxxG-C-C family protein [Photobacterium sanguinicancri]
MEESIKFGRLAEIHFENGLLCAESVVSAIAEYQGVDDHLASKMATGFCSGVARTCGPCGALSGAVMGISLALGRESKSDTVVATYEATQELVEKFESEFGAKDCHKLLGCDIGTEEGMAHFRSHNLRANCSNYTRKAAEIAVSILSKDAEGSV